MTRAELFARLTEVFQDVFDDETLEIGEETTAADVEGWDSLAHIGLIAAVEEAFDMTFPMKLVVSMKNVGEMADVILERTGA